MKKNILTIGIGLLLGSTAFAQWVDPGNDATGTIYYQNGDIGIGTNNPRVMLQVEGATESKSAGIISFGNLTSGDLVNNVYRAFSGATYVDGGSNKMSHYMTYRGVNSAYLDNGQGYGFYSQGAYPRMFMEVTSANHGSFSDLPADSPIKNYFLYQQIQGPAGTSLSTPMKATDSNSTWLWGVRNTGDFIIGGQLGIGTTNPLSTMEVSGLTGSNTRYLLNLKEDRGANYSGGFATKSFSFSLNDKIIAGMGAYGSASNGSVASSYLFFNADPSQGSSDYLSPGLAVFSDGRVGIGTNAPGSQLTVTGTIESTSGGIKFPDGTIQSTAATGSGSSVWSQSGATASYDGNVGIGTTAPQYDLDIVGTVRTCEIKVSNLQGWCDYVFEEDYKLPALEEVEAYIKTNKST